MSSSNPLTKDIIPNYILSQDRDPTSQVTRCLSAVNTKELIVFRSKVNNSCFYANIALSAQNTALYDLKSGGIYRNMHRVQGCPGALPPTDGFRGQSISPRPSLAFSSIFESFPIS
jgi:hypothetical protein